MLDRWATPVWRTSDGAIETLQRVPADDLPFKEARLRDLLSQTPSLLPVRHFDAVFSDPVSLGTEFRIPGVGRVDALFLSPSGYLTIVETKLWRNPEARRKVVAQIIDYAQRLARWRYSDLETAFKDRRTAAGDPPVSLSEHVCEAEDDPTDEIEFVNAVTRCLRDGRFVLLVIGDGIREGLEEMAEFLQQTPTLRYTLGLVELACYQRPDASGDLLFVPQVVAQTDEIIRAVVRIDLRHGDADSVEVSAQVPSETPAKRAARANQLSEDEFYALLSTSASPDSAHRFQEFIKAITEEHESIEVSFSPTKLSLTIERPGTDESQLIILAVTKSGTVRTLKATWDFLSENLAPEVVQEFIDGLGAVDSRLRPRRKTNGAFTVPKGSNAADLVTITPKLKDLAAVVSKLLRAMTAGSDSDAA